MPMSSSRAPKVLLSESKAANAHTQIGICHRESPPLEPRSRAWYRPRSCAKPVGAGPGRGYRETERALDRPRPILVIFFHDFTRIFVIPECNILRMPPISL
jgi:hypothetical protein